MDALVEGFARAGPTGADARGRMAEDLQATRATGTTHRNAPKKTTEHTTRELFGVFASCTHAPRAALTFSMLLLGFGAPPVFGGARRCNSAWTGFTARARGGARCT